MSEEKDKVKVAVSVLIMHENRILLEKRQHAHASGTWGPPTGHIDFGETPEQTAVRETREETGLTISNVSFRAITNDVFTDEHDHYVTIWMQAEHFSGEAKVAAPSEESEVGWYALDALPEPLYLPLANLLKGNTYPSPDATDTIGEAKGSIEQIPHLDTLP